jgi:hypothetical protein
MWLTVYRARSRLRSAVGRLANLGAASPQKRADDYGRRRRYDDRRKEQNAATDPPNGDN